MRTPSSGSPRPRVLIVEDQGDTREVYAWCLRAAGWQVDTVTNGLEALVMAASVEPDVIVMDVNLPVLDGIRATRTLKGDDRTAGIPVVACTAHGQEHGPSMAEAGFEKIVSKPCTPEELRAVLEDVIARRSLPGGS